MSPKQDQIVALNTMAENFKDEKIKTSKSLKTASQNQKGKGNQSQPVKRNGKVKTKGNKDRQMYS